MMWYYARLDVLYFVHSIHCLHLVNKCTIQYEIYIYTCIYYSPSTYVRWVWHLTWLWYLWGYSKWECNVVYTVLCWAIIKWIKPCLIVWKWILINCSVFMSNRLWNYYKLHVLLNVFKMSITRRVDARSPYYYVISHTPSENLTQTH